MPMQFNPITVAKKTRIIIESGTWVGGFVDMIKNDYEEIHTIEIVESLYIAAKEKFKNTPNVRCHCGHSPVILDKILSTINEPVTFWLDAHYQGCVQSQETKAPLLNELSIISNHHIKEHVIMIDDVRLFGAYNTSISQIENILRSINKDYNISYHEGVQKNDVVVASMI